MMETSSKLGSDPLPKKPSAVWAALKTVKTKLSLTEEGSTPVDWKVVFLVFLSLFSSSFNLTYLFPFLPEMILTFGYQEAEKGYYAGIIASALFIGRTCGSYFWGWLSDKRGRKPVMLLTLLLNGTCCLAFGFTTNIYVAFITRFLSGLANGTVGTAKTVLYETTDNTNQAVGMSIISVAWGSGLIVGPAIGGYLANPCRRYPESFPSEGFFYQFPYIFPGMFAFFICIIAFVVDLIWLPETLNKKTKEIIVTADEEEESNDDDGENTSLHSAHRRISYSHTHLPSYLTEKPKMSMSVENLHVESEGATYLAGSGKELHLTRRGISFTDVPEGIKKTDKTKKNGKQHFFIENEKLTSEKSKQINGDAINTVDTPVTHINGGQVKDGNDIESTVTDTLLSTKEEHGNGTIKNGHDKALKEISDSNSLQVESKGSGCWYTIKSWSPIYLIRQYDVFISIALYSLFSFGVIGVEEIFTVWTSTDVMLDGLGFEPDQIGTVLGSSSLPLLFIQLLVFPHMIRRLGITKTLMVSSAIIMIVTQSLPCLHLINSPMTLWVLLLTLVMVMKLMACFVFSCTGLFINNSVTPEWAGTVNGLAMTIVALFRSMAPIFGGTVYSWTVGYASENIGPPFDVSFIFFLFGIVYWMNTLLGLAVPEKLNKQKK